MPEYIANDCDCYASIEQITTPRRVCDCVSSSVYQSNRTTKRSSSERTSILASLVSVKSEKKMDKHASYARYLAKKKRCLMKT